MVCEAITSPANEGELKHLREAFYIEQLYICGHKINLESNRLKNTARSTEKSVTIIQQDDSFTVIKEFIRKGFKLVGVKITPS